MKMAKLTTDKYKCIDCGKLKQLVIVRGKAVRCQECYGDYLTRRRVIRQVNRLFYSEAPRTARRDRVKE